MKPEEIKPDTQLCTILGYNAQTGKCRKYFNAILKANGINATGIALNIKDEHFDVTMESVADSKVTKMILEEEFKQGAVAYCDTLNSVATSNNYVDYIEIKEGQIIGGCLDEEVDRLVENPKFVDENMRLAMKMMLLAKQWYGAKIDMDLIPTLI